MNRIEALLRAALLVLAVTSVVTFSPAARAQDGRVVTTPTTAPIPMPASSLPTVNRLIADILQAESSNNANDLVVAYGQSVRDPQLARGALSALLYDFYRLRALAGSAMQASQAVDETSLRFAIFQAAQNQVQVQQNQDTLQQNQRIIEQNDAVIKQNEVILKQNERMIVLLGEIARKK